MKFYFPFPAIDRNFIANGRIKNQPGIIRRYFGSEIIQHISSHL
jgi:hypothetical protein